MNDKPKYELCPRCELNYFMPDPDTPYCSVCLAELKLADPSILIPDEDSEIEVLCPVCKVNFMAPDESLCFLCAKEQSEKLAAAAEEQEDWLSDTDTADTEEEPIEISLSELEEEELEDEEINELGDNDDDYFAGEDDDGYDDDYDEDDDDL